jgi:hypothetical protein
MTRERRASPCGARDPAAVVVAAATATVASSAVLAGLGAAVLGGPLAVLAWPMSPYDDPKVWALWILMALTGVAGTAAWRRIPVGSGDRFIAGLVLACVGWSAVATVTSLAPVQSVLGTFGRGLGLLTIGLTALAFFLVRAHCRTPGAIRWLVDVVLLGSVPVVVLALGQAVGWDPLPKAWDPAVRTLTIRSTFGTHVFLGSYLVVLAPLTLGRLLWALGERSRSGPMRLPNGAGRRRALATVGWVVGAVALVGLGGRWPEVWWALLPWAVLGATAMRALADDAAARDGVAAVVLLSLLLAGQVLVVLLSQGRGAFIGLMVGIGVTGFGLLARRRAWKTLGAAAVAAAAVVAFVVLLNVPGSPLARLAGMRVLGRLGEMTDVEWGSPGWVRIQLWRAISDGWRRQLRGASVLPDVSPRVRSLVGYGPDTQLIVLEPLTAPFTGRLLASADGWNARYVFDRAHNALLDRLITEGLGGVALWLVLLGSVAVIGVARIRSSGAGESAIRLGALGAIVGHFVDGQVGMATPVPLLLFWVSAALLTSPAWRPADSAERAERPPESRVRWRSAALVAAVLIAALVGGVGTRWLLASMAYASGVRRGIAGQLAPAYAEFRRAAELAPWLSLPAESAAYTALRLATAESRPARRMELLEEADAFLRQAGDHAVVGPAWWALKAQIAFAEARSGRPSQLAASRDAFAVALRLRPNDARLLAQSALVWLESGDAAQARRTAERALSLDPKDWIAWTVLARVSKEGGDAVTAQQAVARARELAPAEARASVEALLR